MPWLMQVTAWIYNGLCIFYASTMSALYQSRRKSSGIFNAEQQRLGKFVSKNHIHEIAIEICRSYDLPSKTKGE